MVPYHGGAFLPIEDRFISQTYRRIRGKLWYAPRVRLDDAVELMCVYRMLDENFRALCAVFQISDKRRVKQMRILMNHEPLKVTSEPAFQANMAAMDDETGLGALQAMLDFGWKYGRPPEICRRALQSMRKTMPVWKIAEKVGIPNERMRDWLVPRKPRRNKVAEASASLLIGQ